MGFRGQPPYQVTCQWAHVATGLAIAGWLAVFGVPWWVCLLAVALWIPLKEIGWDILWPVGWPWSWCGEDDTWQGSLLDAAFYGVAIVVAALFFALANHY